MDKRWKVVFSGGYGQALLAQSELEARGIPAFVPDQYIKLLDPFVAGGNILDRAVFVPAASAEEARELLESTPADAIGTGVSGDALPSRDLESRARWICWSTLFPLAAPWAWYQFYRYFAEARRLGRKSKLHRLTSVAMVLNTANLFQLVWPLIAFARGEKL